MNEMKHVMYNCIKILLLYCSSFFGGLLSTYNIQYIMYIMYMYTELEILDNTAKTCNDECHARTCSSSNSMSRTSKNGL